MSLRPGIGALALDGIVNWLTSDVGSRWLAHNGDVPDSFLLEGRSWPFGRYLMQQIRMQIGWPKAMPRAKLAAVQAKNADEFYGDGYVPEFGISLRRESARRVDAVVAAQRNNQNKARKVL